MRIPKSESLTGGSGVHVFLVLWKAARAVEAYAEKSILGLEMCGTGGGHDAVFLSAFRFHFAPLRENTSIISRKGAKRIQSRQTNYGNPQG